MCIGKIDTQQASERLKILTGIDLAALVALVGDVEAESFPDNLLPLSRVSGSRRERAAEIYLEDHPSEIEKKRFYPSLHIPYLTH